MSEEKKDNRKIPVIFCESELSINKHGKLTDSSKEKGVEYTIEQLNYLFYLVKKGEKPKKIAWPPSDQDWANYINDK